MGIACSRSQQDRLFCMIILTRRVHSKPHWSLEFLKISAEGMSVSIRNWIADHCWKDFQNISLAHKTKGGHFENLFVFL